MDYNQARLRTDLDALAGKMAALSARVETFEQQAKEAVAKAQEAKPTFFTKREKK